MDFEQLVSQNEAERRRRSEREARQRTILQQRIQEVKQEMVELKQDIDGCLTEMESCFNLLLPRFELPDIYSTSAGTSQDTAFNQDTSNQDESSLGLKPAGSYLENLEVQSRRRMISSSGSFVSLSEGSGSEGSGNDDEGGGSGDEGKLGTSHKATVCDDKRLDVGSMQSTDPPPPDSDSDSDVEWEDVEPAVGTEGELGAELQEHGMASLGFSVPVQLNRHVEVRETEDNSSILAILHERRQMLLTNHLPTLSKCMEVRGGVTLNSSLTADMT